MPADEHQRRVIQCRARTLRMVAPAGSGKTQTIVERVLGRIAEGMAPERVLVLTFDRAARRSLVERSAEGYGVRVPIVPATKETLVDALRPLVEDAALRREVGAASRAYVERVHDADRIASRLLEIYRSL